MKQKTAVENLYAVTCEGQYYRETGGRKGVGFYTLTFTATEAMKNKGLLSVFKQALIPKDGNSTIILRMMKEKYPDYTRYRTMYVTNVKNMNPDSPPIHTLTLMNRAQIIAFINQHGYPIEPYLYPLISDLRQALRSFRDNPAAFHSKQESLKTTKGADFKLIENLETLNSSRAATEPSEAYVYANIDIEDSEVQPEDEFAGIEGI